MTSDALSSVDGPRVDFDRKLTELVSAASEVLSSQSRLRALLRANQTIVAELDLDVVLRHVLESAVELVHARYGALGVLDGHGGLERFMHVGMPGDVATRIGHLPHGLGLLGALITDPRPIRLSDMSSDPRSAGFPAHHPAMRSLLGVPIRVRGTVYGNLYLTDRQDAEGFTEEDEELVVSLATTAGFAIENARLFEAAEHRRRWAAASAETTAELLAGSPEGAVNLITARLLDLADADGVIVGLLDESDTEYIVWRSVQGDDPNRREGSRQHIGQSPTASLIDAGQPVILDEEAAHRLWSAPAAGVGPLMAIPLLVTGRAMGILVVSRRADAVQFTEADLELVSDFAGRAAFAFELASARAAQDRALLFEDRGRIARDLHDQAIQQLFGMGLQLQGVYGTLPPGRAAEVVDATVVGLDEVIAQIRNIVFTLSEERRGSQGASGRQAVADLVGTLEKRLGVEPALTFTGPVDTVLGPALLPDVLAVITEAVSNAAKHAGAARIEVLVRAHDDHLTVDVSNDGLEFRPSARRGGLANMEQRAATHGGSMSIGAEVGRTRLRWIVPVGTDSGHGSRSHGRGTKGPSRRERRREG